MSLHALLNDNPHNTASHNLAPRPCPFAGHSTVNGSGWASVPSGTEIQIVPAATTKLFNKYPHQFELTHKRQPNKVRYILPASK